MLFEWGLNPQVFVENLCKNLHGFLQPMRKFYHYLTSSIYATGYKTAKAYHRSDMGQLLRSIHSLWHLQCVDVLHHVIKYHLKSAHTIQQ